MSTWTDRSVGWTNLPVSLADTGLGFLRKVLCFFSLCCQDTHRHPHIFSLMCLFLPNRPSSPLLTSIAPLFPLSLLARCVFDRQVPSLFPAAKERHSCCLCTIKATAQRLGQLLIHFLHLSQLSCTECPYIHRYLKYISCERSFRFFFYAIGRPDPSWYLHSEYVHCYININILYRQKHAKNSCSHINSKGFDV